MARSTADIGRKIKSDCDALAGEVVDRFYLRHPKLAERYGPHGRKKCGEDARYHLNYLAQALIASEPALFRDYIGWAKVMLAERGIAESDLADNLKVMSEVLAKSLPPDDAVPACDCIDAAAAELPSMVSSVPSCIGTDHPLTDLAKSYLAALLAGDRHEASRMILDAAEHETTIQDLYLYVFEQSQHEIGRLWQANQITVAQEHYCTAATQMIMSQLYPRIFSGPRIGRLFVGTCVSGDLHEIGIRMISDFFEMEGWSTVYLGANVPIPDLIRTLTDRKPDVVGISATLTPHISSVQEMVSAIRAAPGCVGMKILVGGYPFTIAPDLWNEVGADGTSSNAQSAIDMAKQLILN